MRCREVQNITLTETLCSEYAGRGTAAAWARAFSQQHAAFSPAEQRRRIVARLQELFAQPPLEGRPS
jgi:hypothetical protein